MRIALKLAAWHAWTWPKQAAVRTTCEGSSNPTSSPARATSPTMLSHVLSAWKWLEQRRLMQATTRRLHVAKTVSLGEKRFVSILEVDGVHYLIGGSAGNLQLLTTLPKGNTATHPLERPQEELL